MDSQLQCTQSPTMDSPPPSFIPWDEVRRLERDQHFMRLTHFKQELADLVAEANPTEVSADDPIRLKSGGLELPVGTVTQLFPESLDGEGILISPSTPELHKLDGFQEVMAWVNGTSSEHTQGQRYAALLRQEGAHLRLPDYICESTKSRLNRSAVLKIR